MMSATRANDDEFELRPGETVHAADQVAAHRFRDVLGRFASGITVVTGLGDHGPVGLTVQGFLSVSLDPPLVVFAAARTSRAWPVIERSGGYCVNLLAADQQRLAEVMATRGADKFHDVAWTPSPDTGSPVLEGGLGHVDCTIERVDDGGDHVLVLGRVVGLAATEAADALLYYRGRYGSHEAG
jgi:3-hydroxy-9,10-secoandrosta-1,3,5(10)-triene-9,17-dione monooxygenase reductase component